METLGPLKPTDASGFSLKQKTTTTIRYRDREINMYACFSLLMWRSSYSVCKADFTFPPELHHRVELLSPLAQLMKTTKQLSLKKELEGKITYIVNLQD